MFLILAFDKEQQEGKEGNDQKKMNFLFSTLICIETNIPKNKIVFLQADFAQKKRRMKRKKIQFRKFAQYFQEDLKYLY
jgi:hypothetical protein